MIYYKQGSDSADLSSADLRKGLFEALEKLGRRKKVLIVPPDFTRFHSRAGDLTTLIYDYCGNAVQDILPALGTHAPMTDNELEVMFKGIPRHLIRIHDWRQDVVTAGIIPGEYVSEITEGAVSYSWPAQLNKLVLNGGHDLIISVGQVVPHEVIGMAGYNKNLLVGTGGPEGIHKSHFIGAIYGIERIMGKVNNPVRKLLNEASSRFMNQLPILYIHTVIDKDDRGRLVIRGLFIGDDEENFRLAADLSLKVNFAALDEPLKKVIVYLDPTEYKSTWLGNKSIYRTRMAIADQGEIVVIAPGVSEFGEDKEIDRLIRKYGYKGAPAILNATDKNTELQNNLGAAAHLIHGSSEGRFSITYCPGHLTCEEIESVNFNYHDMHDMMRKYNPEVMKEGYNMMPDGEKVFYISNPALGLWTLKERIIHNNKDN